MFKFTECRHLMPGGRKCHAPALRGKSYCYHHTKLHFRRWGARQPRMLKTLALDNARSLQTAVAEVLAALGSPLTDPKRAAVILYGLNLANNLSKRISPPGSPETKSNNPVRNPASQRSPETTNAQWQRGANHNPIPGLQNRET